MTVRPNREQKIQDGGRQTETTFISACSFHCRTIMTATRMFLGWANEGSYNKSRTCKRMYEIQDGGRQTENTHI